MVTCFLGLGFGVPIPILVDGTDLVFCVGFDLILVIGMVFILVVGVVFLLDIGKDFKLVIGTKFIRFWLFVRLVETGVLLSEICDGPRKPTLEPTFADDNDIIIMGFLGSVTSE